LGGLELFGLRSTPDTTSKSTERDDLLVLLDVSKISISFGEFEA
jgi:hypothetical protein